MKIPGRVDARGNLEVEVWHSALLWRLLEGKRAFVEKPPLRHAYPDYLAMERSDA